MEALKLVPGIVYSYWPALFTFAGVRVGTNLILNMVPRTGAGLADTIVAAATAGFADMTKFAAWQAITTVGPAIPMM